MARVRALTSRAMAHTKPASSRAMAVTILFCGNHRAASRFQRAHRRNCAFQARSRNGLGNSLWRRAMIGVTRAGRVEGAMKDCAVACWLYFQRLRLVKIVLSAPHCSWFVKHQRDNISASQARKRNLSPCY